MSIMHGFKHRISIDSAQIMTINRGPAFVIACEDFQRSLVNLSNELHVLKDRVFTQKVSCLEERIAQLAQQLEERQTKNNELQGQIEFMKINMKNIIDSQVTQRTSQMFFQLDQFRRFTSESEKDEFIRSV